MEILKIAVAFLRIGGVIFALPIFGDKVVPIHVRIMITVALTIGIFPVLPTPWQVTLPTSNSEVAILVIRELVIGLIFGFLARLLFDAFMMAADVVGYQMGFGTSDLFMPDSDAHGNFFTILQRTIMVLMFLSLNLHFLFIQGLVTTFSVIPAGKAILGNQIPKILIDQTSAIFALSMQLAAPVLIAILFSTAALGLIARTVPKFNVYSFSFPINFFIGLLVYIASLPFYPSWLTNNFQQARLSWLATFKSLF